MRAAPTVIVIAHLGLAGCGPGGALTRDGRPPDDTVSLPDQKLEGTYFVPTALLGRDPGLPTPKRPLAEQRRRFARARGDARAAEAAALAGLLWVKDTSRPEALAVLRDAAKSGAPDNLVEKLALAEIAQGEIQPALERLDALAMKHPASPDAPRWRALAAFHHLRRGEDFQASQTVEDLAGAPASFLPEVAYVRAWLAFRAGDLEAAGNAIALAANRWKDDDSADSLADEIILITTRAGADPSLTAALLSDGKPETLALHLLGRLADGYLGAGDYARRAATLERMAGAGDKLLPAVRVYQSDTEHRLGHPDRAADRLIEAWEAAHAAGGGDDATPRPAEIAERIFQLGSLYQHIYTTTLDALYGTAARRLYAAYLDAEPALPRAEDARGRDAAIARVQKGVGAPSDARLDRDALLGHVAAHAEQLRACYERWLQGEVKLEGAVSLSFDVDERGQITGVTTRPPAGDGGMPAVAGCMAARVRAWSLPRSPRKATTRVQARFACSRRKE